MRGGGVRFGDLTCCVPYCTAETLVKSMAVALGSKVRQIGMIARGLRRVVGRGGKLSAWADAARTTGAHFRRVLGQLWLEVTGFVFLSLAAIGALAFVREYTRLHAGNSNSGRVALAICFTVMFGWFGVSSFWRVRKRS